MRVEPTSAAPTGARGGPHRTRRATDAGVAMLLVALALGVRLYPAWQLKAIVNDVATYFVMGEMVLRGDNLYAQRILFPYTPFTQVHPALAILVSRALGWTFDFAVKLPEILADGLSTAVIYAFLRFEGARVGRAALWSMLWVLNPVSILISAFHGNIMAATPFFVLGAFVAARVGEDRDSRSLWMATSALLLGMGVAVRTYPILLLPTFIVLSTRTIKEAVVYVGLVALAPGLSSLPYLIYARQTFLNEVLGYGGFTDFGWVAVLRAGVFFAQGQQLSNFGGGLLPMTRLAFLYAYGISLLVLPYFRSASVGRALAVMPLLFYAIYAGVCAQYLVWVLPVAIALRDRVSLPYTLVATLALLGFYAFYAPGILGGRYGLPPMSPWVPAVIYTVGNVLLVIVSLWWLIGIFKGEFRACRAGQWSTSVTWVRRLRGVWFHWAYGLVVAMVVAGVLVPTIVRTARMVPDVMRSVLAPQYHYLFPPG